MLVNYTKVYKIAFTGYIEVGQIIMQMNSRYNF